ncbi:YdcF family protein [uncultured Cohaesibacter sp.]|uniref:YdcF family protein n=1 Tax=uncultured Cohaesibacter sp. TaxID=1002546 RepID=UPI0029C7BA25|nr:YdcF family protein [uncultured Cohaesibacter sp.]
MIGTIFFVFSKIAGLLLLVESWLFFGMLGGLIFLWRGRVKAAKRVIAATALLLLLVVSPLTDMVLYQLEKSHPSNPDLNAVGPIYGILTLGGSTIPNNSDTWQQVEMNEAGERVTETMRLARLLPEAKVLLTGGSAAVANLIRGDIPPSEAAATADLLVSMGLDRKRLILEKHARNTAENARLSARLLGEDVSRRWLLVTSAFHMVRAMDSFQKAGFTDLVAYPVDHRSDPARFASDWYPGGKINRLDTAIREFVGRAVYDLTGR